MEKIQSVALPKPGKDPSTGQYRCWVTCTNYWNAFFSTDLSLLSKNASLKNKLVSAPVVSHWPTAKTDPTHWRWFSDQKDYGSCVRRPHCCLWHSETTSSLEKSPDDDQWLTSHSISWRDVNQ